MTLIRCLLSALTGFALASTACAHVFAVFTAHSLLSRDGSAHGAVPAATAAYVGWGHKMPVEGILEPERLQRYGVIAPDGSETPLRPSGPGFLAAAVAPGVEGAHIVAAAYRDHFFTWYEEAGVEIEHEGPKTGLEGVVYSGYFEMRGKALVGVGRTGGAAFGEPIGDTLEIVPLENPLRKTGGAYQTLKVRVLFRGEPLAGAAVHARHQGLYPSSDFSQAVTTDADGAAMLDLTHKGGWLLKVEHETGPRPEFEAKCNIEQYAATLSFEIA